MSGKQTPHAHATGQIAKKHVLLVASDRRTRIDLRRALVSARSSVTISEFDSPDAAELYLFGDGADVLPDLGCGSLDLIVLNHDTELPRLRSLIAKLRADAVCSNVPTIVISRDDIIGIQALYSGGCNSLVVLSPNSENSAEELRVVAEYWLCANISPSSRG